MIMNIFINMEKSSTDMLKCKMWLKINFIFKMKSVSMYVMHWTSMGMIFVELQVNFCNPNFFLILKY